MRSHSPTYFVTAVTANRTPVLQPAAHASLLCELMHSYRNQGRFFLHAFVVMPDHLHALITPSQDQSLERCVQCVQGGFSHSIGKVSHRHQAIWQRGFHEHRIRDAEDYARHVSYIIRNPERRGLRDHKFLFAEGPELDSMPEYLSG